jgi:hypothetical protein
MKQLEQLIGCKILKVQLDDAKVYLNFVTDTGDVTYSCYGDCCSESWINHVNGVSELLGGTVQDVDEVDFFGLLNVEPEATRQEFDSVLFHRIKTEKGWSTFEFRNSSNGYYGGSLDEVARLPDDVEMQDIADDF